MSVNHEQVHPHPQPSHHQRKIELQSPQDLVYLQDRLAAAALSKLDLHFPHIPKPATQIVLGGTQPDPAAIQREEQPQEEDDFRRRVRGLVSEFLNQTWSSAQLSVTLNGIDASTLPVPHTASLSDPPAESSDPDLPLKASLAQEEREGIHYRYSAFDPRLQQKVASLYGELEKLTAEVSALRRTAPKEAASRYQNALDAKLKDDEDIFTSAQTQAADQANIGLKLSAVRPGWSQDLQEVYEQGLQELAGLAGTGDANKSTSLTEIMGKVQRARNVTLELD